MGLPRWKRTGGRDFVFYHSHPGFEWDDLDVTTAYQETICNDFQAGLADPFLFKCCSCSLSCPCLEYVGSAPMHTSYKLHWTSTCILKTASQHGSGKKVTQPALVIRCSMRRRLQACSIGMRWHAVVDHAGTRAGAVVAPICHPVNREVVFVKRIMLLICSGRRCWRWSRGSAGAAERTAHGARSSCPTAPQSPSTRCPSRRATRRKPCCTSGDCSTL